jgi:hypothetical protein
MGELWHKTNHWIWSEDHGWIVTKHQPLHLKWRSWVSSDKNTNHWIWSEDHGWVVTKTSMVLWMIRYNTLIGTIWWWVGVDRPIIKHSNINSKAPHCCNLVWTSRGRSQSTNFSKNLAKIQHHLELKTNGNSLHQKVVMKETFFSFCLVMKVMIQPLLFFP